MKALFTLTLFRILLFKGRSILAPAQQGTGSKRVNFSMKKTKKMVGISRNCFKSDSTIVRLSYRVSNFITNQITSWFCFWMLHVSWTGPCEVTRVHLSVHLSIGPFVYPSLSFLKIGSLAFYDIVHHNSWRLYLVNDEARFLWKKNFGPSGPESDPKWVFFVILLSFDHTFSLKLYIDIACDNV